MNERQRIAATGLVWTAFIAVIILLRAGLL